MKPYFLLGLIVFALPIFGEEVVDVDDLSSASLIENVSNVDDLREPDVAFNLFKSSESKEQPSAPDANGYTINYNTVSIIEYIRFASKICNVNFLFDTQDLDFTVTVVSKEPITPENVMGTLVQILRIHGLQVLEQDGNLVIHKSDDVRQLAKVVTTAGQEGSAPLVTRVFRLQNAKPESLGPIIKSMISSTAILETSAETRQLILTDITPNIDKVAALIESLDSPHTSLVIRSFAAQFNTPDYLVEIVGQLMNPIAQGNPFHLVPASLANNVYVVSTPELADRSIEILTTLDLPQKKLISQERKLKSENIFVYKLENRTGREIIAGLEKIATNLEETGIPDSDLMATLRTVKWIHETNSMMIVGGVGSVNKVKEFIAALDVPITADSYGKVSKGKKSFFVYRLNIADPGQFESSLKSFAKTLDKSNASDDGLTETIETMKYVKETTSFLFTGPEPALKRLQDILPSFDGGTKMSNSQFLNYTPVYHRGPQLLSSLKDLTEQLKADHLNDPMLIRSLELAKWIPSTNTILFSGDPSSLKKVQELMATIDVAGNAKNTYYIYKLQYATAEQIEEDLDRLSKDFHSAGWKDAKIVDVIKSMRYVKETNSLLLTGNPDSIDEVKDLIAKFDYPREAAINKSNFYMYKPQNLTAANIEKSLRDVGKSLTAAGLADSSLLSAINSVKYVEATNSLIFTGSPDALSKVNELIKEVDVPPSKTAPIQHIGAKTFLLYKLQHASGPKILSSIKEMTADLKKSGTSDKPFVNALGSVKYVKETNSLMFTGDEESLKKVEALVERFDVTGYSALDVPVGPSASNFFVYKPQSVPGPDLERFMHDFAENLRHSGLADVELFRAISSMRWVEKTQSLLFTGSPKALDQVKELLRDFDIPSNLPAGTNADNHEPMIQAIDNTSFLVYKLQFHKGDEIQGALRQIAKDLIISNAPVNQNLLNSINSIQWLEVTNSLLCSGDQETLTRLRELIKNLDIPLKQVFIEILMIQTSLSNSLTFGLEWGAQYKYRNKFSGQINNITPASAASPTGGNSAASDPLLSGLSNVTPTKPPVPGDVNIIGPGFDLGVIGEVIRHGGDTYLTIGSLMAALQVDAETTIVMTPKILTQDGRTSSIFQGSNIPFAGSFISNNSASAGANATIGTTNIEYRDIGVNLTITPVLGNSDIVSLDIALEQTQTQSNAQNQQIIFNQNGLPSNLNGITTSKVTMQTTVHVPDDHFLILSGIVNNSNTKLKTGIPCLGSLPLIGAAFSQDNTSINNNSVVIFLRPHIIASLDDMNRITKHEETFFRDQTSTPFLERNYNDAMETIKTIDDE